MKTRCYNSKVRNYGDYGGRGIKVCRRWLKFENFLADMGERPPGMSIDRIDNDGDYKPRNCKWSTRSEQITNQRKRAGCSSRYKGVSWSKSNGCWIANVTVRGTRKYLGLFNTEEKAHRACRLARSP